MMSLTCLPHHLAPPLLPAPQAMWSLASLDPSRTALSSTCPRRLVST